MEKEQSKNLESIKQELITLSELKIYLNEIQNKDITVYEEIERIEKKQSRLQYERRYFKTYNRFPKERNITKVTDINDMKILKKEIKKARQNANRWLNRLNELEKKRKELEASL